MPTDRDLARAFKAARWEDQASIDAWVREVSPASTTELRTLLSQLTERGAASELATYRRRIAAFAALVEAAPDPQLFVPCARALRTADVALRNTLASLLPRVNHVDAHGELCQLLEQPDADLRKAVAGVLRAIGGRSAFNEVAARCEDPEFLGRVDALDAFVPKARGGAIPMLKTVLAVGSVPERARALTYLGDRELMARELEGAIEVISEALDDSDDRIIGRAIEALASVAPEDEFFKRIGAHAETTAPHIARSLVEALRRFATVRSIELLRRRFRVGPTSLRIEVLDSLEAIGNDAVLPVLAEALSFSQLPVRERASRVLLGLTRAGKVDLARTMLWLLRSTDVNVRRMAVEIARGVADRASTLWQPLMTMLRDEDWWVRERVMDVLSEVAGEHLTRYLVGMLEDPSEVIRRFAIGALLRVKDPKSLGALVRCAQNDTDWWVRETAVLACAELGDARAVPYLVELLSRVPEVRHACIEALRLLRGREGAAQVGARLADEDPDVRLAALRFVDELEVKSETDRVRTLSEDPVLRVRIAAREVMERWSIVKAASGVENGAQFLDKLLASMTQAGAEDLIAAAGRVPYVKRHGKMCALGTVPFNEEHIKTMIVPLLTKEQRDALARLEDIDFSYESKVTGQRFRAHVFRQMAGLSVVFRSINGAIPELEKLGLPSVVATFAGYKNGLVLVGGPTGSGKSTTLAAIVDHINRTTTSRHIVTLEDPIEVVHQRKGCLVSQREVGTHTRSFHAAMRSVLRQDPDVILVGEMRDLDMVSFAVTAAETGHLVFGTVHTSSAETTVDRLVNVFPPGQQPQVRSMLSESLRAVICQHLIPRKDQAGRVLVSEVMVNNDAVSNLIRKGKSFQIPAVVATSRDQGMQSMDSELMRHHREGRISAEEAYLRAVDKKAFETAFGWSTEGAKSSGRAERIPERASA